MTDESNHLTNEEGSRRLTEDGITERQLNKIHRMLITAEKNGGYDIGEDTRDRMVERATEMLDSESDRTAIGATKNLLAMDKHNLEMIKLNQETKDKPHIQITNIRQEILNDPRLVKHLRDHQEHSNACIDGEICDGGEVQDSSPHQDP